MRAVAIVTAAGSAVRFGGPKKKLLVPIDGKPLLDHTIRALLEGGAAEVIVVVGRDARAELERDVSAMLDARVRPVENPDPSRGMFSSIQEGAAQAQGDLILVMPGDMPYVSADTVRAVIAAYERRPAIVSPRYRGKRGHPVAFPSTLRDEIRAADPRATLHDVIQKHNHLRIDVEVEDRGIVRDVDTPADLEGRAGV
jgi:molybdenum cofactor cytidylyltransferase